MSRNFKISGIYKITNSTNGKFYIGSSIDVHSRWEKHINDLNANRHHNKYLQNSWNKHGQESFIFTVVEIVDDENLLLEAEQLWIDNTKCYLNTVGYNISDDATRPDTNLSKSFAKVARISFQQLMLGNSLSISEKSVLFSLLPFVCKNENAIKVNGKYATHEQLINITGYKRGAVYNNLKTLTEKNLLKTVKKGIYNVRYLNPYYIRYDDSIDKSTYEIFDSK